MTKLLYIPDARYIKWYTTCNDKTDVWEDSFLAEYRSIEEYVSIYKDNINSYEIIYDNIISN